MQYNRHLVFISSIALKILLKDEKINALLEIAEVKDNELVLMYENDMLYKLK